MTENKSKKFINPLTLCICAIPFGIAVHGIVTVISSCWIFFSVQKTKGVSSLTKSVDLQTFWVPFCLSWLTISCLTIATISNPQTISIFSAFKSSFGYLFWVLGPFLAAVYWQNNPEAVNRDILYRLTVFISMAWGLVAISQYLFGWRISGVSITPDIPRPRGLYSHPLTFAYVVLFFWPINLYLLKKYTNKLLPWLSTISIGVCILLSQSRTVQAVSCIILLWNLLTLNKKQNRKYALFVFTICISCIFLTKNPFSQRFIKTFSTEGVDKFSDYPDDRLAFWHVHGLMIKDKPLLGHGLQITSEYRTPYYNELGLQLFEKKYEAHNTFIEIATNGGIITLILFIIWVLWYFSIIMDRHYLQATKKISLQIFVSFLLAGITQNSFQDSEVRFILTIFCAMVWISHLKSKTQPKSQIS